MGSLRLWDTYTQWRDLEPSKGVYDWTNLDANLALAQAHKVDVIYTFGYVPLWAASGTSSNCALAPRDSGSCYPPTNTSDWDDFVTAVVNHSGGKIKYWELWNEPDLPQFWSGTTDQLATLSQHAYNIIKTLQPSAVILSPAPAEDKTAFFTAYFAAAGTGFQDIVAFHGYPSYQTYAAPENINAVVTSVRNVMTTFHISGEPIWDTEASWGLDTNLTDYTQGAGYLARLYILQWASGVSRFYWYAWNDGETGTLWTNGSGVNVAGTAYQEVFNWLVGSTSSAPCSADVNSTWTCKLTRPGGYQAVAVWNSAATTDYSPGSQYTRYLDLAGNSHAINGTVTIGYNPILLESQALSAPPTNLVISVK